ncbi:unnamed protein product [Clonostachys solani]|uniref:Uncharacterized protein n=1 Tax=Clonostachys solani TaxID=160281 RepID=A0A9P0EEB1_9HYPO|nr:unnamed protein product [Clonostachys solani]
MNERGDGQDGNHSSRPDSLRRSRPSTIKYYLAVLQRIMYSKHPKPAPVQPPASPGLAAPSEHGRQSMPPTPPPSPVNTIFHLQYQAPLSCPADRLVPSFIRPWHGFENGQQARLQSIHSHLPDSATFLPSLDHLAELESLMLSESQNADLGSKLVQIFFHYAVEVPVAQIISVLNALPTGRPLPLMGGVFSPPHLDTFSTSIAPPARNAGEQEQRINWLIPSQSYVCRREDNDLQTKIPICVNQYHSPDDLNLSHLQAGLDSLSRLSEPLTNSHFGRLREVGDSPNWTFEERKALLAVTNAYTVMVKSGLSFGLVATGDAILFLTLDPENPGTLFFKLMNPTVDDIKIEDGRIYSNSAAAAQCLSFYFLVLLEASQNGKYAQMPNTRGCYCNNSFERVSESIQRRGYPEAISSPPRLTANWPPHLWPPEPPPVPIYAKSLQLPFALGPSPNPFPEIVTSLNSHHLSPSTIFWTRSVQLFKQNTSYFPMANRNVTTVQGIEASGDWPDIPFASHQSALPPIDLCSAGAEADYFTTLPPIVSNLMGHAAQKLPIPLGAVPCSHLPTLLPRPSHSSQPQAGQNIVNPDEEMTRRLAVSIQHRQEISNKPTGGLQPTSEDHQPRREDTLDGWRDGCTKTQSDEAVVKLGHGDGGGEEKYNSTDHQKREPVPAHALPQSTDGSSTKSSPDASSNPYCTHLCLLGLIAGQVADLDCPNAGHHRRADEDHSDLRHKIGYTKFLDLVTENFHQANEKNHNFIDENVIKVTLSEYSYTFVCKRFEQYNKSALDHEVAVYDRLSSLQGKHVPILLGQISLRQHIREYCEPRLVHYTLMSSAGAPLAGSSRFVVNREALAGEAEDVIRAFHDRGVCYTATLHNTFFDDFQKTVTVAGLGRATIFEDPPDKRSAAGKKHARDDATAAQQGRPNKKRRTETYSAVFIPIPMSLTRMAELWAQNKAMPLLQNLYEVRSLFGISNYRKRN